MSLIVNLMASKEESVVTHNKYTDFEESLHYSSIGDTTRNPQSTIQPLSQLHERNLASVQEFRKKYSSTGYQLTQRTNNRSGVNDSSMYQTFANQAPNTRRREETFQASANESTISNPLNGSRFNSVPHSVQQTKRGRNKILEHLSISRDKQLEELALITKTQTAQGQRAKQNISRQQNRRNVLRSDPGVWDTHDVQVPQKLKITGKFEDNSVEVVRQRLRNNNINHLQFTPALTGEQHRLYFKGVYQPNKATAKREQPKDPDNFFACWMKYRTPDQLRPLSLTEKCKALAESRNQEQKVKPKISDYQLKLLQQLKELTPKQTAFEFQQLLQKMESNEVKSDRRGKPIFSELIKGFFDRVYQKGYENYFAAFRSRIEQMIQEGYSMQPITKEDIEQQKKLDQLIQKYKNWDGSTLLSSVDLKSEKEKPQTPQSQTETQVQEVETLQINNSQETEEFQVGEQRNVPTEIQISIINQDQEKQTEVIEIVEVQQKNSETKSSENKSQQKKLFLKKEFITPKLDLEQIADHRKQTWEKVQNARPSNFSLPLSRRSNSILWREHFKVNKFYKPEKLLLNAGKQEELERHRTNIKNHTIPLDAATRADAIKAKTEYKSELANKFLPNTQNRRTSTASVSIRSKRSSATQVDVSHPFYDCLNENFTKPSLTVKNEEKKDTHTNPTYLSIKQEDSERSAVSKASSRSKKPFKPFTSGCGPQLLTLQQMNNVISRKLPVTFEEYIKSDQIQTRIYNEILNKHMTDIGEIDKEKAAQKRTKDWLDSDLMIQHEKTTHEIDLILSVYLLYLEYQQFGPKDEQFQDVFDVAKMDEQADEDHFSGQQTVKDFKFDCKELSEEIMRVCNDKKIWTPISFNQSKELRAILGKGVTLKEQKPPPKFQDTLRPGLYCPNQLYKWKM